ncbi:Uncharacterised protein [Legionella beliardensis]|uniref:Uncharacterized protein n=1 Tax=Legionella beliardensis TaxID=91822 RepID=A0A378I044_9GAMM|nr:hypothetical protein [Legionella beliardensis]STX28080.1 Uncharacterised protein [Legionella beliardensis]
MVRNFITPTRKLAPTFFSQPKIRLASMLAPHLWNAANLAAQAIILTKFTSYLSNNDHNDDQHNEIDESARNASLNL